MEEEGGVWVMTLARHRRHVEELVITASSRLGLRLEWTIGGQFILTPPMSVAGLLGLASRHQLVGRLDVVEDRHTRLQVVTRPAGLTRRRSDRALVQFVNMVHAADAEHMINV